MPRRRTIRWLAAAFLLALAGGGAFVATRPFARTIEIRNVLGRDIPELVFRVRGELVHRGPLGIGQTLGVTVKDDKPLTFLACWRKADALGPAETNDWKSIQEEQASEPVTVTTMLQTSYGGPFGAVGGCWLPEYPFAGCEQFVSRWHVAAGETGISTLVQSDRPLGQLKAAFRRAAGN